MVFRFVYSIVILVLLLASCILGRADDIKEQVFICDDGKVGIEKDLSSISTSCQGDRIDIKEYLEPAGESFCLNDGADITEGGPICMKDTITYDSLLPLSGNYRPLPPKYGEYSYLPPQRWLHALKYGAVAFLYHPCAPLEQIMELKSLAKSCLRKHIITPYPHLTEEKPLAMVSWGCSYIMSWVDRTPAMRWVQEHALKTLESIVTDDGRYDNGLIEGAQIVSFLNDSVICPVASSSEEDSNAHTTDSAIVDHMNTVITTEVVDVTQHSTAGHTVWTVVASNSPQNILNDKNCSGLVHCSPHQNHVVVVLHTYPVLTGLIVLTVLVVFTLSLFLFWIYCFRRESSSCAPTSRKKRLGRYKQCGQLYKVNSGEGIVGIAIPELGVPKTVSSEREKLLLDSDEDDL